MRKIYLVLKLIFFCLLLSSCSLFLQSRYEDISQHPRMRHLIGRCLELKQDVFLYQYTDTKTYALDIPGSISSLPTSIKEYQNDPLNWENTDTNAKMGRGKENGYCKEKIIAVIPRGTKLYVAQIQERQTYYESFVRVIAYLDNPTYSHLPVNIYFLLEKNFGDVIIPYPSEPELTIMGREIIPYPKPGVIEYCDEPAQNLPSMQ